MTGRADIEAANPATGEVLEQLDQQPPEALAEALDAVNVRKDELKRWGDALEGELRRRLRALDHTLHVYGDWEVECRSERSSEWDGAELDGVIHSLLDQGIVKAGDVADVIVRPDPVVSRSAATRLARRLTGESRAAVEATCTWKEKPGKVKVVRSVQLPAPPQEPQLPPAAEGTSSDGRPDREERSVPATPQGAPARSSEPPAPRPMTHEELFA